MRMMSNWIGGVGIMKINIYIDDYHMKIIILCENEND